MLSNCSSFLADAAMRSPITLITLLWLKKLHLALNDANISEWYSLSVHLIGVARLAIRVSVRIPIIAVRDRLLSWITSNSKQWNMGGMWTSCGTEFERTVPSQRRISPSLVEAITNYCVHNSPLALLGIVTRQCVGQPRNRISSPGCGQRCISGSKGPNEVWGPHNPHATPILGTVGYFLGRKTARPWSWTCTSIYCQG